MIFFEHVFLSILFIPALPVKINLRKKLWKCYIMEVKSFQEIIWRFCLFSFHSEWIKLNQGSVFWAINVGQIAKLCSEGCHVHYIMGHMGSLQNPSPAWILWGRLQAGWSSAYCRKKSSFWIRVWGRAGIRWSWVFYLRSFMTLLNFLTMWLLSGMLLLLKEKIVQKSEILLVNH